MQSIVLNNKVLDFKYKRCASNSYTFHVGDLFIGRVFKLDSGWSVVGAGSNKLCPVHGFKTRYSASEFLLKLRDLI